MGKTKFSILFIFLVYLVVSTTGCNNKSELNKLDNNWEYLIGSETDSINSINKNNFKPIDTLEHLEELLPEKEGYIWLKNTFTIPNELASKEIALQLGRISMADKTYLNGELIGSGGKFPPNFFSNWNEFRYFPLSQSIVRPMEENTLLIKIYMLGEGSLTGDLILDTQDLVLQKYKIDEFLNSNINIIISSILLIMSAYYFFMYFKRRKDKANFYFGVLSICTSIYLTNFFISKVPGFEGWDMSYVTFQKIIFITLFVSTYSFVSFIREFLSIKNVKWQDILVKAITFLPIIVYFFLRDYTTLRRFTNYFQLLLVIPVALSAYYIIKSLFKKNKDAYILLIGICPLIFTVLFDLIVNQLFKVNSTIYLTGFGLPIFLIINLFILSGRFVSFNNDLEELNVNLETKVKDRTEELNKSNITLEQTLNELQEKNIIAKKDMDMAASIQRSLYPLKSPTTTEWSAAHVFKPMSGVSGDIFDYYMLDGKLLGLSLLDVSGHGIASGLITMIANSISKRNFFAKKEESLSKILDSINMELIKEISNVDNYLTGIFLRLKDNLVEYVNAGHTELLHKSGKTGKVTIINQKEGDFKGCFLGIEAIATPYKTLKFRVQRGDILFLYSDCLNETRNTENQEYGMDRIIESLETATSKTTEGILKEMMDKFYNFTGTENLSDDLTAIIVKKI